MTQVQTFLKTPAAARALGISPDTLRFMAKGRTTAKGTFVPPLLQEGEHWRRRGDSSNSPLIFDVEACQEILRRNGYSAGA